MSSPKVAIVTGANTGIGKVTALELGRRGFHTILACRNEQKAEAAIAELRQGARSATFEFLRLDLNSLASVRDAAADFLSRDLPLHLLVNNAGLAGSQGITADGFELTFGVNHLGHFLFTQLLEDKIVASAKDVGSARIVNVASRAHYRAKPIDWSAQRRPTAHRTGLPEYAVSKLANVLHASELARRLAGSGVTTYSLHPGVVASDVWRQVPGPLRWLAKRFMITNEEGAQTSLYCATDPRCAEQSGLYYDECALKTPSAMARDAALATELWERSEEWTKA